MTQRERRLAMLLGGVAVVGGLFLAYQLLLRPLQDYATTIAALDDEIAEKEKELQKARKDKQRLERWRLMSLPVHPAHRNDTALASREYGKYLDDLFRNRLLIESFTPVNAPAPPAQAGKPRPYTALSFNVRGKATLGNFVKLLRDFQQTPLLHKIKSLTIERVENTAALRKKRDDVVTVAMTVEALVVTGAERRPTNLLGVDHRLLALDALTVLRRGPAAIALVPSVAGPTGLLGKQLLAANAPPDRTYDDIAKKNIFQGQPEADRGGGYSNPGGPIDVTRYTFLTSTNIGEKGPEAFYYIRTSNRWTRLRESLGFNAFQVKDEDGQQVLVDGKVVRIESRDVYFRVGNDYYKIHIGQNFEQALRNRLSPAEVEALGLASPAPKAAAVAGDP
jgi:hypothetical protein